MTEALATAGAITWISILVKALVYATTLVAAGSVLAFAALPPLPGIGARALKRTAVLAALAAALLSAARLPVRASFLMGGTLEGAQDPMLLSMVAQSPLGDAVFLRLLGLALILTILLPGRRGLWLAMPGAALIALSFALRGHALDGPRLLLGALVFVHVAGLSFWVGSFAPLRRAALASPGPVAGALAERFGQIATGVVAALVLAGAALLVSLAGPEVVFDARQTAYGQFFAVKLVLFATVLSLAAWNKLRLTPALIRDEPGAGRRLHRAIGIEAGVVGLILLTTAALTTVSAPGV